MIKRSEMLVFVPGRAALIGLVLVLATLLGLPVARAQGRCGDIASGEAVLRSDGIRVDFEAVAAFYDLSGGLCAWDDASEAAIVSYIGAAGEHGLDPELFHADAIIRDARRSDIRDILLTDGALKYAGALTRGLSAPDMPVDERAADAHPQGEAINSLSQALSRGQVAPWLALLQPKSPTYDRLKAALSTYRAIVEAGGWQSLPEDMRLRRNRKSPLVSDLKRRLAIEGDLTFDNGAPVYSDAVRAAVLQFQERNGLRADGKVNAATVRRLNISAAERVAQIALNMERWRLDGRDLPATRVDVNVPDATAVLFRDNVPVLKMNAVVGAPGHDTPTLTSTIDTIVLNPPWNIPRSIIQGEIKPILKRDPKYLIKNRMYWSGDQLIQESGPHNALGRIKFEFPNRYSVYLHDTPARQLFTDPERAQSHGCVRLERPLELATALLEGDPVWTREAIEDAIRSGETIRVPVPEPVTVVIAYRTVFVADDGLVQFRPDIYGLDTQLTLALSQKVTALRSEPLRW
ncbi:MAG: L,D-transpeptidase family protein [Micropepsaceae bacterium]